MTVQPNLNLARDINLIMSILGTTKASLWPFFEATGTLVSGIGLGDLTPAETGGAAEALEDDFAPVLHPGGVYSYHFHPTGDHHLAGIDSTAYTFGDGSNDAAFSIGMLILPNDVATVALAAKYDATAEEWAFRIDSGGNLELELHDASASATEVGTSTATIVLGKWQFVVVTYDGDETAPEVLFYVDGEHDGGAGATTETGSYVAMEDTATPLTIGCSDLTATPAEEFHGRMMLPFITGKVLSASEIKTLWSTYQRMAGGL